MGACVSEEVESVTCYITYSSLVCACLVQGHRRRKLHELFGYEEEVIYCSDALGHSQQNRCLVSGKRLRPASGAAGGAESSAAGGGAGGVADGAAGGVADRPAGGPAGGAAGGAAGSVAGDYEAFFAMLNAQFRKYEAVLPVDLRARGLVSAKYGHDGTGLV